MRAALLGLALLTFTLFGQRAAGLSRSYLCFFDTGSAALNARCGLISEELAGAWSRSHSGEARTWPDNNRLPAETLRVEVHGHADGTEPDAAALSRARADAVADVLQRRGVPAELITVVPWAANRLLVPIKEAEPQNRRVEIVLR